MPVFLSQMFFFDINSNIYERSLVYHVIKILWQALNDYRPGSTNAMSIPVQITCSFTEAKGEEKGNRANTSRDTSYWFHHFW